MNLRFIIALGLFLFLVSNSNAQELKDCPKSPNCVCTTASKKMKRMSPIPFKHGDDYVNFAITALINKMTELGASIIGVDDTLVQFEVITKRGNFVDEVDFLIDEANQQIHFRSASKVGYYDFGANRRRMKKLRKALTK